MKTIRPPRVSSPAGITLLEMTVVIGVLMTLLTSLFVGSRAWRKGADRASCIMTLRNLQQSVRSYQNIYGFTSGERPAAIDGDQDIARHLLQKGYIAQGLFSQASGVRPCNGGGTYKRPMADVFPQQGDLYAECSLAAADEHVPQDRGTW